MQTNSIECLGVEGTDKTSLVMDATYLCGISSTGRAFALQARGYRSESCIPHQWVTAPQAVLCRGFAGACQKPHICTISSEGRALAERVEVVGSSPTSCTAYTARIAQNAISFCYSRSVHLLGECSSEEERRIVAPKVEISKFFTYPICGCRLAVDGASLQN